MNDLRLQSKTTVNISKKIPAKLNGEYGNIENIAPEIKPLNIENLFA